MPAGNPCRRQLTETGPGHTVLTAAGEIDIATVARLRERLFTLADEGRPAITDLNQVNQPRARIPAMAVSGALRNCQ
jgi:hypothetical protein